MSTFSLNGRIGLNVSDLVSNADKARKAVIEIGDELDDVDGKKTAPTVSVDDKATADILSLDKRLDGLEGDDRTVVLDAESARLKSKIKSAERQLQGLDAEQARPVLDLRNKAKAELDQVEKQLRKDIPDAAEDGGKKASGNLASSFDDLKGAGGKLLGGAVGAAIVGGLQLGMERIAVRAQITQQFGLIEKDAARLGQQAADIYAGGWGEGTAAVMTSLSMVNQRLVETGIVGVEETARIGESATVLAEVFGMDVSEVIEATSKLMLNGLAPDAQTAMDLLGTAMQEGGNAAGDLFESVDEYAQHFADFGLSAEDMMALFVHGMQNGQRDTDKLADAVKEMRIRTVDSVDGISDAYADLGLDADAYRLKILAGGPSAKKAFGEIIDAIRSVEDPIERNRIAVELMGTPIEDLGVKALDSFAAMGDGVDGFNGKIDEMNVAMTEAQPSFERLKRAATTAFGEMAESAATEVESMVRDFETLLGPWPEIIGDIGGATDEVGFLGRAFGAVTDALNPVQSGLNLVSSAADLVRGSADDADEAVIGFVTRTNDLMKEMLTAAPAVDDLSESTDDLVESEEDLEKAADDAAEAMERQEQRAEDLHEQIVDLYEANIDLVGGQMAVTRSMFGAQDAAENLNEVMEDSESTERDRTEAMFDAIEAQDRAARSASDLEIAQRQANGETFSAFEMNEIHRQSLIKVAETLEPGSPLRLAVQGLIDDYGEIPDKVATTVSFSAGETEAHLLLIEGMLDGVTRPRTVRIRATFDTGGFTGMLADGGPAKAGGTYLVGEEGPELVTFGRDSFVHDAAQTSAILARGAGAAGIGVSGPAPSSMSNRSTGSVTAGDVNVSVQIGQTELRDMIQDVVVSHERQMELVR